MSQELVQKQNPTRQLLLLLFSLNIRLQAALYLLWSMSSP